jgi:transposase
MDITVLGVDLRKNVCGVVGLGASGAVVMRRTPCCGAHHLGRVFAAHSHDVRLMSPEYVRPH